MHLTSSLISIVQNATHFYFLILHMSLNFFHQKKARFMLFAVIIASSSFLHTCLILWLSVVVLLCMMAFFSTQSWYHETYTLG